MEQKETLRMKKITLLVLLSCMVSGLAGCIFDSAEVSHTQLSYDGSRLHMYVSNGCGKINPKPITSINNTVINNNDCAAIVSAMEVKAHLRNPRRVYNNTECHVVGNDIDCSFGWSPVHFANGQRSRWRVYFSSTVLHVVYQDGTRDDTDVETTNSFDVSTIREVAPADSPLLCDGTCGDGQHCDLTQNKCVADEGSSSDDLSDNQSADNNDGGGGCSLNPKASSKTALLPMLLVVFLGLGIRKYLKTVIHA